MDFTPTCLTLLPPTLSELVTVVNAPYESGLMNEPMMVRVSTMVGLFDSRRTYTVVRNDGGTDWAFSLLDTVVDPALLPKPIAADYDPRWNAVVGGTCRDYYNIRFLAAMVGPAKPLVPWDAKKVLAVKLSVQEMP